VKQGEIRLVAPGLWRGFRPRSFEVLQTLGVRVDIDLETGIAGTVERDTGKPDYEEQYGGDFGVEEIDRSMSNLFPPNVDQVFKTIEIIQSKIDKGLVCYVHCLWGKDRTGFVIAAYRMIVQGWSYEQAREEMFAAGFRRWVYWYWLPYLKRLEGQKIKSS
jgi:protein tyrosine/serine phosphatase